MNAIVQQQGDMIYYMFRKTTEPYDYLDWDGTTLEVWLKCEKIETYTLYDFAEIIDGFPVENNND